LELFFQPQDRVVTVDSSGPRAAIYRMVSAVATFCRRLRG
jgi:hypothetical protein